MYQYAAFSWNAKDSASTASVQRLTRLLLSSSANWQEVLDLPGLRVFHVPQAGGACHAYSLKGDGGVVLGKLFERGSEDDDSPSDPSFDERESKRLLDSRGRRLVERYWGYYVAFLRTSDGQVRYILRDPSGGLPCHLMELAGVDVILSDMEDCVSLELPPFSVNWDHVIAYFLHARLITQTTGFQEVTNLYAGECLTINDAHGDVSASRVSRSFYWDPVDVYEANTIEDPNAARASLRSTVRYCVAAWASSYDSALLELSGGLDSSIVAACLAESKSDIDVLCLNYFTEMSHGDERSYAQIAARSAGFELVETETLVSEEPLESLFDRSRRATPSMLGLIPATELLKRRLIDERRAGAVFSGQGGDHLFQHDANELIAAEYAQRHGLRPRLLGVLKTTSSMTAKSIWSVGRAVTRYGLLRRPFDPYSSYFKPPAVLSEDVRQNLSTDTYDHPWVRSASHLPASKIWQVLSVVDCQPFFRMPCPNAELVHPLISQPLIERCLQIPVYVLTHRGKSRGLVREAFEEDVPAKIIRRRSKGTTTSYFARTLVENAAFLRARLLDGALMNAGILDRRELESLLSERNLISGKEMSSILTSLRAEMWLSNWEDTRQRTAA